MLSTKKATDRLMFPRLADVAISPEVKYGCCVSVSHLKMLLIYFVGIESIMILNIHLFKSEVTMDLHLFSHFPLSTFSCNHVQMSTMKVTNIWNGSICFFLFYFFIFYIRRSLIALSGPWRNQWRRRRMSPTPWKLDAL